MSNSLCRKTLLDTNALLYFTLFPEKSSKNSLNFLEDESQKNKGNLYISIISALEIGLLVQKNRLPIKNSSQFWHDVCDKIGLQIIALSAEIIFKSFDYNKMNSPFDKIIAASSVTKKLNLLTSDNAMIKYFSNSMNQLENLKIINSKD